MLVLKTRGANARAAALFHAARLALIGHFLDAVQIAALQIGNVAVLAARAEAPAECEAHDAS